MGNLLQVANEKDIQYEQFRQRMLDMKRHEINDDFKEYCLQSNQSTFCRDMSDIMPRFVHNPGACIFIQPAGIERSCIVKLVAKEKFEEGIFSGVIYFAFPKNFRGDTMKALLESIGCYKDQYSRFSDCVPWELDKEVLLILDNLENAQDCPDIAITIANLAVQAVNAPRSKEFVTLALCDDKEFAKEIAKKDYRIRVEYRDGDILQDYFTYGL